MTPTPKLALHELHEGGGVPLVLLPAFPLDARVWKACARVLPWGIRAIGVDLPGQGHSDIGGLAPSLSLAADAIYNTLTDYGIGNAIVCGLSMGGYAALALAERHPAFVSGLGLIDTKSTEDTPEIRARRIRIAKECEMQQTLAPVSGMPGMLLGRTSLEQRRNLLPTVEGWIRGQAPGGIAWAQRAMAMRRDQTETLTYFTGPVAVVVGSEDMVTPLSDAEHMMKAAPDGALTIVPGAGHLTPIEEPRTVAQALALLHSQVIPRRGVRTRYGRR
jgi:pimeloyl-ACP methyl ester carboxylesterase